MSGLIQDQARGENIELPYRNKIENLLTHADIKLVDRGQRAERRWDLEVNNDKLFARILGQGTLGLGEAYMEGWWECEQLDEFFARVLSANLGQHVTTWTDRWFFLLGHLSNRQIGRRLKQTAASHYNFGNDLYTAMLDPRMIYTCAYWQDANTLSEAQTHKLELTARKLKLEPGMKVLDIGCGWGGAAEYMAQQHDVEVVGITLSEEQYKLACERSAGAGTEFRLQDYHQLDEKFDRIYSLGMFEHVGFKNFPDFFRIVDDCLIDNGLFLLHTIGHRITNHKVDPWIDRYIFPNSILPSAEMICQFASPYFHLEDWHNFGMDYHRTLMAWDQNLASAWHELPDYDEQFQRMWHYFLMSAAGAFKARKNHLWQIVFSKGLSTTPYQAVRSGS